MIVRGLLFTLLVVFAGQLAAETRPRSLPSDPRIREYVFDPHTVYRLDVFMKFITSIHFAPGEEIQSIQIGDSASWEVVRLSRGDVLSVKPIIEGAYTNMTVLTDRRNYTFELRAKREVVGSHRLNYRISFRYPKEDHRRLAQQRAKANRPKDFNYMVAGDPSLRPVSVHDDGVSTVFRFPDDEPRPAIFRVDAQGREAIVNVRSTPDGFIVDATSDLWTLRRGSRELCVAHANAVESIPGADDAARVNKSDSQ